MGVGPFEGIIAKGQIVPLVFMQDAVAASQSDVQLPIAEVASGAQNAIDAYYMPWGGEIVGVSARLSAAGTAGNLSVGATLAGTEDTDTTVAITTEQSKYVRVPRGKCVFDAGALIGCELTTDGSWDGTSSDIGVVVWVLLHVEGI